MGPPPKTMPRESCSPLGLQCATICVQRRRSRRCPERCPNDAQSDGGAYAKHTWPRLSVLQATPQAALASSLHLHNSIIVWNETASVAAAHKKHINCQGRPSPKTMPRTLGQLGRQGSLTELMFSEVEK